MNLALTLFFKMLVAHAVCDYPLQGDFLARAKNHRAPVPGVPWALALSAHAVIQAGAVWLITGSALLGALELACHAITDYEKCDGAIDFAQDQALHVFCKIVWAWLAVTYLT
jgi:hypothetical protein